MKATINENIQITVKAQFQENKSSWDSESFVHSYVVKIKNNNHFSVKLLERCWFIFDSKDGQYTVFGEGVIGKKPIIEPGESYEYSSYCELSNMLGRMKGFYNLRNEVSGEIIRATIPPFNLEVPLVLN